jgi:hypothetical protein
MHATVHASQRVLAASVTDNLVGERLGFARAEEHEEAIMPGNASDASRKNMPEFRRRQRGLSADGQLHSEWLAFKDP